MLGVGRLNKVETLSLFIGAGSMASPSSQALEDPSQGI
jgi:hypothetical protein